MLTGMASSVVCTLIWGLSTVVIFHRCRTARRFVTMALCFLASVPCWLLLTLILMRAAFPDTWTDISIPSLCLGFVGHLLLFFLFVEAYYHVDRSVTLAILETVLMSEPRGTTDEELRAQHDITDTVEKRIDILCGNGYLARNKDGFELTRKGRFLALITIASTRLFRSQLQKDRIA